MNRKMKKLQLKKTVVVLMNDRHPEKIQAGVQAATAPIFSCKIYCGPTYYCPPPAD